MPCALVCGVWSIKSILLVSGRHWNLEAVLSDALSNVREAFVLLKCYRTVVSFDDRADLNKHPGPLREVVHKQIVPLSRVLPEVEHLWRRWHVFLGSFPPKVCVNCKASGNRAVVASKIEKQLYNCLAALLRG